MSTLHFKFDSDRKSQAKAQHLFDALLHREPSPTCPVCGGLVDRKAGPAKAACVCPESEKAEQKEDGDVS